MMAPMGHRPFKNRVYPQFARVAQALASDRRLELVDLLAQAPRHVEALAEETDMSLANVSQHLQVLKQARLVESEKAGTRVIYRIADPAVLRLWLALRTVAEQRLPEVGLLAQEYEVAGAKGAPYPPDLAQRGARTGEVFLIDVRPSEEFAHGHLPGAISFPPETLESRLYELPRDRPIVAYCRGSYCLFADEAVALLRERGFEAHRLDGGWLEWQAEDGAKPPRRSVA
jgi:rhodanese-related sulfurtransferase/DNA-binding transcriptional ArsR family regulator